MVKKQSKCGPKQVKTWSDPMLIMWPKVTWPWGQKLKICDGLLKDIFHLHNGKLQDCEWNTLYTVLETVPLVIFLCGNLEKEEIVWKSYRMAFTMAL